MKINRKDKKTFILVIFFLLFTTHTQICIAAIPNDDCLGCHDKYTGFNHKKAQCWQCHNDITSIPHEERLKSPRCINCHKETEEIYKKSIHSAKKLNCKDCHNTHFLNKDRKTCLNCHANVSHRGLPAREKHLKALNCLACHSKVRAGNINISIDTKNRNILKIKAIDRDENRFIDYIEWGQLLNVLNKELKEEAEIKKEYNVITDDAHGVMKRPVPCMTCHGDKGIFRDARITIKGKKTSEIKGDYRIFIHELPSIEDYKHTIHGKKGVVCSDCHKSDKQVTDRTCLICHKNIYEVYKGTTHAKEGATKCTDCHNPHKIRTYKELTNSERVMICARCHKDYIDTHKWLPHTILHFKYLECSSCHSPESKKGMLLSFAVKEESGIKALSYLDFENVFGKNVVLLDLIDTNRDKAISLEEFTAFVNAFKKKYSKEIAINTSIVVTDVHHNYSEKNLKSKVCNECHLLDAPFYKYILLSIPQKDRISFFHIKGTVLSAFPTSLFIDLCILGETKIKHEDVKVFLKADFKDKSKVLKEMGFKLIDFIGLTILLFIFACVFVHILIRVIAKR